nr:calumenin-B [Ipomoea batatas]
MDGDGQLNITEFNDFLHPADTTNPKLLLWLCKEEIRERDSDKDGKVNFNEFFHGLFDLVDLDKDGRLTLSEMIDSPYVFYSAIFNEDEESDYDEYHDEEVKVARVDAALYLYLSLRFKERPGM